MDFAHFEQLKCNVTKNDFELINKSHVTENVTSYWKRDAAYQLGRKAAAFVANPVIVAIYPETDVENSGENTYKNVTNLSFASQFITPIPSTTPESVILMSTTMSPTESTLNKIENSTYYENTTKEEIYFQPEVNISTTKYTTQFVYFNIK